MENNLFPTIGKVLTEESNIDILSELTWALVNITYFEAENGGNLYMKEFINRIFFIKYMKNFLGIKLDSDVSTHIIVGIIVGIRFLFICDLSEEKTVFNIIKKNNFDIFDKLFISFDNIYNEDNSFSGLDILVYNKKMIICHFIQLSKEKDVVFLVQNTQLINFIIHYFEVLFFIKT